MIYVMQLCRRILLEKKSAGELYCLYSVRIPSSHPTRGNENTKGDFYCDFFKKCSSKHKHSEAEGFQCLFLSKNLPITKTILLHKDEIE